MADLTASPDYLKKLSADLDTWKTDHVNPAVAAIPADWGWQGIAALAAEGATVAVLALKYKTFKARKIFEPKSRGYYDPSFGKDDDGLMPNKPSTVTGEDIIRVLNRLFNFKRAVVISLS